MEGRERQLRPLLAPLCTHTAGCCHVPVVVHINHSVGPSDDGRQVPHGARRGGTAGGRHCGRVAEVGDGLDECVLITESLAGVQRPFTATGAEVGFIARGVQNEIVPHQISKSYL